MPLRRLFPLLALLSTCLLAPNAFAGNGALGATCKAASDCASNWCVFENDLTYYCSEPCSSSGQCPTGYSCDTATKSCFKTGRFFASCVTGSDCSSKVCVADSAGQYCSASCSESNPTCPYPTTCTVEAKACFRPVPSASADDAKGVTANCALSPRSAAGSASALLFALASLTLLARRRRPHATP